MSVILNTIQQLRDTLKPLRINQRIALVPTMGNLHAGHLSLVELAKKHADLVVVSIFVNPTQFGENEDFDSYPRTLEADVEKLENVQTDYVFAPSIEEMYPQYPQVVATQIQLGEMAKHLCGHSRPGHFDGVGLIVSKLFNIVQPDVAVFGQKDYQQAALIIQLVEDLSYAIDIIKAPIFRAEDGLALSSRNQYLTAKERQTAPELHSTINELCHRINRGEHLVVGMQPLIHRAILTLNTAGFEVDYLQVLTQDLRTVQPTDKQLVVLVAAWLGSARLLDNQEVCVQGI